LKKILTEEQIKEYDQRMRLQNPGYDTFFVSSAAYEARLSKRTLQNYIYSGNSDFSFIKLTEPEVPDAGIATCQSSIQASGAKRREARQISFPRYPFAHGFSLTDCSSGPAK